MYLFTLAPSVLQIDSGELSTVQAILGIAHPTGYPLFTLIGFLFSKIPLPFSTIYKLNVLAALYCAMGIFFFLLTMRLILNNFSFFEMKKGSKQKLINKHKTKSISKSKEKKLTKEISELIIILSSLCGGLLLAFSKTDWFQSTSVEVYSLNILLISIIIFFLIKAYITNDQASSKIQFNKYWFFFTLFLALGFTNHMTTLLILPGAAFLYFDKYKFNKNSFKFLLLLFIIFIPILIIIYSYLPIRASHNPELNWGNPIDLERFFRHISGKQYQVWLFTSLDAAKKQFSYFISSLFNEFNIGLILIIIGIFYSYFKSTNYGKKIFYFLMISFLFTILYSINYDINDIDSYFLLAYIFMAIWGAFGSIFILNLLRDKILKYFLPITLLSIIIIIQFTINYSKVDQSDNFAFEDYTKSAINNCDENSLILSYQWDYLISPSYYFQFVENYRKDVVIIDKELLRRSWYYNQIKRNFPVVIKDITPTINNFLKALEPFEKSEKYDAMLLENLYQKIITEIISSNIQNRTIYIAPELFENEMKRGEFNLPAGYTLVPDLFFFKVTKEKNYISANNPDFNIRFPKEKNFYTNMIENFVGSMLVRRALYEMQFDNVERAKIYIQKVKNEFPAYPIPKGLVEVLSK